MRNLLEYEVFEEMKENLKNENFGIYLDTWAYEDEYSHNDIENARSKFIELANGFFCVNMMDYEAKEVCENVYILNKNTREKL